jgi:hypothetical protein
MNRVAFRVGCVLLLTACLWLGLVVHCNVSMGSAR